MCGRSKLEERSERESEQAAVVESDDQTARVFRRRRGGRRGVARQRGGGVRGGIESFYPPTPGTPGPRARRPGGCRASGLLLYRGRVTRPRSSVPRISQLNIMRVQQ